MTIEQLNGPPALHSNSHLKILPEKQTQILIFQLDFLNTQISGVPRATEI